VSGKDSLNNEYRARGTRLPVIPTLLISAFGPIEDVAQTIDMALKEPGNFLYQVGMTSDELAGSHYVAGLDRETAEARFPYTCVPNVHFASARATMKALGAAIRAGQVRACHDMSEGGLAVAAAEMALASLLGLDIDLARVPHDISRRTELATTLLFSESASRFLVEVAPEQSKAFENFLRTQGVTNFARIGTVTLNEQLTMHLGDQTPINLDVSALQAAWKGEEA
jgi:phosphoribosylformylglycinamidine synthase